MKIGYPCIPLTINAKTTRSLTLKTYSEEKLKLLIEANLKDLLKILTYNKENHINIFRISSDIIPLGSHEINKYNWLKEFESLLKNIGNYIKENNLRVSMHPGQYTVLNSPNPSVVKKSIKDLEFHASFLDSLNLNYTHKIILHIGGIYNSKKDSINRFIKNYNLLPNNIKNRLVIENDEKNFSLDDIIYISKKCSIPIIFDNLHNECFNDNNYSLEEILLKISPSWNIPKDGNIKVHYSQQNLKKKLGSHSKSIKLEEFLNYYSIAKKYNIDIMLEVKDKDFSALKIINTLKDMKKPLSCLEKENLFSYYNLYLLHKGGYSLLNKAKDLLFIKGCKNFFLLLENLEDLESTEENKNTAIKKAIKIIKNFITSREETYLLKLEKGKDYDRAKNYIYKLSIKYNISELYRDYYFHY